MKYALTKEFLIKYYVNLKLSTVDISAFIGCNKDTVLYHLKKHGIETRKEKIIIRECQKRWFYQKYIIDELSLRDIAQLLNLTSQTIRYWLKKCEIKRRSRKESLKDIWKKKPDKFNVPKGKEHHMYGKKLPEEIRLKLVESITGANNKKWKGGYTKHNLGYILKDINGKQFLVHRLVMEEYLGRKLEPKELVHHINENKTDNRIENLQIVTRAEHAKIHSNLNQEAVI